MTANPHSQSRVMPVAERLRLVQMLGMLGSDYDGERASAGLLASRLVRAAGLTWDEVVLPPSCHPARPHTPGRTLDRTDAVDICDRLGDFLTEWEADFVLSVSRFANLSPKQLATLVSIAVKAQARARA